ncbi:MAG: histidinol-phosphatase [Brevinema sp.]
MLPQTSIHVHTTYCDGKSTIAELIDKALELNLKVLGFSGHSPSNFGDTSGIKPENLDAYRSEIRAAKAKYQGQLEIILGIEQDFYSPPLDPGYDYIIGSVHSIKDISTGHQYVVDGSPEQMLTCINNVFNGKALDAALRYYETYKTMIQTLKPTVAGHLDLLTKNAGIFDENDPVYVKAALEAAECAWQTGAVVEINTGGMARGKTTRPYPAPFILKQLAVWKAPVTITSDCHNKDFLCHYYPESIELMKSCRFTHIHEWSQGGFKAFPLS